MKVTRSLLPQENLLGYVEGIAKRKKKKKKTTLMFAVSIKTQDIPCMLSIVIIGSCDCFVQCATQASDVLVTLVFACILSQSHHRKSMFGFSKVPVPL